MFKQILVPVDLTDRHGRAVDIAAELAGPGEGRVTVLHVVELIAGLSPAEGKEFYGRLEKRARDHVASLGARLGAEKVTWKADVVFGNRTAEILRYAADSGSDLIVLTSHGIDPRQGSVRLGTLSHAIGLLSSVPVLLVK
jgi:nucleotide-binding universal stress UspA family protein